MNINAKNIRKHGSGVMRGFFDLEMEGLMTIYGCTAMCKDGGWWIGMPQRKGKDKDGNDKWYSIVFVEKDRLDKLRDLVMPSLKDALEEKEAPADSGVGATNYNDDDQDMIPF